MSDYNIYCDESCHLQNDKIDVMVLGAIYCPEKKRKEISDRIREIKERHGLQRNFEIKWNKVYKGKENFYKDIIDYYFDDDDLNFRAIVIDKSKLDHQRFGQSHDEFYYKMYFDLLKVILDPEKSFNIYIDIKDTNGQSKVDKLCDVLRSSQYDFKKKIIKKVQQIRSEEGELLPLADLLMGAIGYHNRQLQTSQTKLNLIRRIQNRSNYSLTKSTLLQENKMNLLIWQPR